MAPNSPESVPPFALSPQGAADYIGCSRQFVYVLMADGRLPSYKIGRSRRIKVADLEALVQSVPA